VVELFRDEVSLVDPSVAISTNPLFKIAERYPSIGRHAPRSSSAVRYDTATLLPCEDLEF